MFCCRGVLTIEMYDHTLVSSRCAKTRLTLFYCSSRFLQVVQSDLLELLGKAVTCAILSKAGQQRSRVLGLLVKVFFPVVLFVLFIAKYELVY